MRRQTMLLAISLVILLSVSAALAGLCSFCFRSAGFAGLLGLALFLGALAASVTFGTAKGRG